MRREFSAGGLLVRRLAGEWKVALVRPAGRAPGTWVLPKGLIEPGEGSEQAALREIAEETGARGVPLAPVGSATYWYSREGERVFKVVSFFLVAYRSGRLGRLPPESRHEIAEARWRRLADAPQLLAYAGEQEMARRALAILADDQSV